jgi:hypothetical protein
MSDIPTKVSVTGESLYPHLVKPDVRFNELGEYKVTLKVAKSDASAMVKEIDQACEDALAKAEKDNKGKKVKSAPKPYKEESGFVFFKYKMKASGLNRKTNEKFTQRPMLFDAKKNPLTPTTSIWGGSTMKIAYQLIPYFTPLLGAGVSARLKAVQIIKLVEGKSQNIFKEEDGFESKPEATIGKANSDVSTKVQTSSDF